MATVTQDIVDLYNNLVRGGYEDYFIESFLAGRGVTPAQVRSAIASGSASSTPSQPTVTQPIITQPTTAVPSTPVTTPQNSATNNFNALINQLYQEQLGRAPDVGGAEYYTNLLASGRSLESIRNEIAKSLEGQNFLTQAITSEYRQELGRNPEQEGYQYWLSSALNQGLSASQIRAAIEAAAIPEQQKRQITSDFTQMQLAALEADPFGGRYATRSIFDLYPDAVNISTIGDRQAQFVVPITQQGVVSNFGQGAFSATPGADVLSDPVVVATINRSLQSGALDRAGYEQIVGDLVNARDMTDVRRAFSTPQAQVIIDQIYGLQTGEDVNLQTARLEAADRQRVIDSLGLSNYPSNAALTEAYRAAGLQYPFGPEAYQGYDTMMREQNVITPENFNERINQLLRTFNQEFGGANTMQTPLTGQYYSETGLQPGFTPFGTEGTTFRSGVAGFIPQAELPTGFQFGAPLTNATFREYRPGAFQPEGVTTGGFITGYTQAGTPIYSTYANPNVNVGGTTSQLIPFANQTNQLADLQAQLAALQANPALIPQTPSGG